jgi:hypothetical protein
MHYVVYLSSTNVDLTRERIAVFGRARWTEQLETLLATKMKVEYARQRPIPMLSDGVRELPLVFHFAK